MSVTDSEPLRILHVSEVHWGGVVTLLQHFTHQQALAGHDVHVLAPPDMPRFDGAEQHTWSLNRRRPLSAVSGLRELRRTVAAVRPDVIHLHSFVAGLLGRLPGQASWAGAIPVVYQPHAWSVGLFTRPVMSNAVARAERSAAKRTDLVVTNCEDEIVRGRSIGVRTPALALGVTVDLAHFRPVHEVERRRQREMLGITDERVMLTVGRIAHQKAQDLLLREWEHARPARTLLALVGPGDAAAVAGLAPHQWDKTVRAFGESRDIRAWLWAADVLVLPSRYETVSLVIAEAMATGLPVVSTAVDGAAQTVVGGSIAAAGAVVGLGDMRALIAAAERRLEDPGLRRKEGMAGRERAEAMFEPESVAHRLENAYLDAIAHVSGEYAR